MEDLTLFQVFGLLVLIFGTVFSLVGIVFRSYDNGKRDLLNTMLENKDITSETYTKYIKK